MTASTAISTSRCTAGLWRDPGLKEPLGVGDQESSSALQTGTFACSRFSVLKIEDYLPGVAYPVIRRHERLERVSFRNARPVERAVLEKRPQLVEDGRRFH